jgi:hypothetical protein
VESHAVEREVRGREREREKVGEIGAMGHCKWTDAEEKERADAPARPPVDWGCIGGSGWKLTHASVKFSFGEADWERILAPAPPN